MAVQPQTPYKEYTANGSTKSFALEFDCYNQDHLIVLVDDVEEIVGTWSLSNGAVVFGSAPASGKKITIQRNTPFQRDGDFQSYDNSFRPGPVNKGFDWIWLKLQELGVADWILSNRIDALKNYVDDRDDELSAYLMEEIRKQGVALDQLDDYYNYLMNRITEIAVDKGWVASLVVNKNGQSQQVVNDIVLDPKLAPLGWTQEDFNDSVVDVRRFIKKDLSNVTIGLQAAIEEAYGRELYIPFALKILDTIYIEKGLRIRGNQSGGGVEKKGSILDFSALSPNKNGFDVARSSIVVGLGLENLYFKGTRNGGSALKFGHSLSAYMSDYDITSVAISGFSWGVRQSFCWDGNFSGVRVQSCTNGIENGNQTNALIFSGCRIVSIDEFALTHTNSEGVQYDSCDVSNLARMSGSPITLFQSSVMFNNPYFENLEGPSSISVGSVSETVASKLMINAPFKLGKNIIVSNSLSTVEINGVDADNVSIVGATLGTNITAKKSLRPFQKSNKFLFSWNALQRLELTPYGGTTLTLADYRNYVLLGSSSANGGLLLATNLTIGSTYTFRYSIRKTASTDQLNLRNPNTSSSLGADSVGSPPTVRMCSFVSLGTQLNMTWAGDIEVFGLEIIEGNLDAFDEDPFKQADFERVVQVTRSAIPATGIGVWKAGDTVSKVATNTNPITEYTYNSDAWKPTKWIILNLPTAGLPILTSSEMGVEIYDSTTKSFKKWNGGIWV
ncbi:hypothetical protein [Acinetobacter johnsonii]|uniref:hypothetical protein n=1 Tax=Acinetobacter johnsonii TaxID=40214 RepID=UPI00073DA52F|nr:hypothetical protein [Acinetobacter johnsonii]ALV72598.1 hypothetical protein RZ95_06600 [Acinetobacter johnsonii XBB1]